MIQLETLLEKIFLRFKHQDATMNVSNGVTRYYNKRGELYYAMVCVKDESYTNRDFTIVVVPG